MAITTEAELKNAKLDIEDHFQETWQQCVSDYITYSSINPSNAYSNSPVGQQLKDVTEWLKVNKPKTYKRLALE